MSSDLLTAALQPAAWALLAVLGAASLAGIRLAAREALAILSLREERRA